jgi:hypothetical protein
MKCLHTALMENGRSYGQKHAATWQEIEEEMIIQNIPKVTSEVGLEGVNEDSVEDVEELLQSHGEILTIVGLSELAEQCIQSEFTGPDAEEEKTPVRELSAEFLSNSVSMIMQIMDHFIDNDAHYVKALCMLHKRSFVFVYLYVL